MTDSILALRLRPCGPTLDLAAAKRGLEGFEDLPEAVKAALAPVFSAAPYLAGLARRYPESLRRSLSLDPAVRLAEILAQTESLAAAPDPAAIKPALRRLKADIHLLTALCDLGGVYNLEQVTGALSGFADRAGAAAFAAAAVMARQAGDLQTFEPRAAGIGPIPGLFALAMGKLGGDELNYSSDIDLTFFYDPDRLPLGPEVEPQKFCDRMTRMISEILSDHTGDGYVFRVDLRLRPDPSSTPPASPVGAALRYYESVGQNWERAAFIKARPTFGDKVAAESFLQDLAPFIWRRSLDFGAIADIHSIKRQIHVHKADKRLTAPGVNLKLGAGGIREIEFYVQTQQLILGGRDPQLRSRRTLEALEALSQAGHVGQAAASDLHDAYIALRGLEHRVQMLRDEQTHILPELDADRVRVAVLSGSADLKRFDQEVSRVLSSVNRRYGELFADDESLSLPAGSLVFTGVEDDPETLTTLKRLGFSQAETVSRTIRAWHHGRIAATRGPRGRELFTRLAPRLLDAAGRSGAPDTAFARFSTFFEGLSAGVQVQSLLLSRPDLLNRMVQLFALAPRVAKTLARHPSAFDAVLDPGFFSPPGVEIVRLLEETVAQAKPDIESVMNAVRAAHREQSFRLAVQILQSGLDPLTAGRAFSGLAQASLAHLAEASLAEITRNAGAFPGDVAVIALGKFGSREMTARSDLDLMTLYAAKHPGAVSDGREWAAETFYVRFTQRLIAALSVPTAEGELYDIDMRLRPSGAQGPVSVSLAAFERYYESEADTWEFMALTRARVVWATSPEFADRCNAHIEQALRLPRDADKTRSDAAAMRAKMRRERPASGPFDIKLSDGGQVDCEFTVQALQLIGASLGGALHVGLNDAIDSLVADGALKRKDGQTLSEAWTYQQEIAQVLRAALDVGDNPFEQPELFQAWLASRCQEKDLKALQKHLGLLRKAALDVFSRRLLKYTG